MPQYDFSTLSPKDFEDLSRALLQNELNCHFESFTCGRDKGIDLRYSRPREESLWIVQAKHYQRSGFNKLIQNLRNSERPKIERLKPNRYILTTSVSLTPVQKDSLFDCLSPFCIAPGDIFGQQDLNNLLAKHPSIEDSCFKLWLQSSAVIQRLLNHGILTQSELLAEEANRLLSLIVPTDANQRALNLLENNGFCMLTGIPGIGKTTTARLIIAQHIRNDWQAIYLSSQVKDAFRIFNKNQKQIFFYDDFLGLTSLQERLAKNEDKDLEQLIRACANQRKSKRLILTTREYLYQQACRQHEILSERCDLESAKVTVKLEDYTKKSRAQILVNHLYFHGIDAEICSSFVTSGMARKTLDHPNYNPRIVEAMCEQYNKKKTSGEHFATSFINMLDNPKTIWEYVFRNQLTKEARDLMLIFAVHGSPVKLDVLRKQFHIYEESTGKLHAGFADKFNSYLKELDGTFLNIERKLNCHFLTFHNPSIKDFTDEEICKDTYFLATVAKHLSQEEAIYFAVKKLIELDPGKIGGQELFETYKRVDRQTQHLIVQNDSGGFPSRTLSEAGSLKLWLELFKSKRDKDASLKFLEIITFYFGDLKGSDVSVSQVLALYSKYVLEASRLRYKDVFPSSQLYESLLPKCVSPDDFREVVTLIDEKENFDEKLKATGDTFLSFYPDWLACEVGAKNSSDEVQNVIDSLVSAAFELGISREDLDLRDAEALAIHLSIQELNEAELEDETIHNNQCDLFLDHRQEIEDILDSLRL
jgi:hypothetical protein